MPAADPDWVFPRYGQASLPDVLPSALAALTGQRAESLGFIDYLGFTERLEGVRRIGVVLVDGLGYHLLDAAAAAASSGRGGAIADIVAGRLGELGRLTAGFPSTTPVSLVGLGTGVRPGEHGVVGFSVRVPGTDRVLNHVKWWDNPDPATWQPVPTMFARAAAAGVATTVVSRKEFLGSGLTTAAYRAAAFRSAGNVDALAAEVRGALAGDEDGGGPGLVYGYHPDLDHAGHVASIASIEWRAAAAEVDRLITLLATDLPAHTAVLITADHGQFDVPDDRRFDIDVDQRLRHGVDVVAGEPRVRYLHTAPGATADVVHTWRAVLGDAAWIATRDEAVAVGLYGPVAPAHLDRIGDVVVICRQDYVVVASATAVSESRLGAYHGALTPSEMEIPLIVLRG